MHQHCSGPARLSPTQEKFDTPARAPQLGRLDLLGRMPVPLRRGFKAGLDQTVAAHRSATGEQLNCHFLAGAEWYRPFDGLATAAPDDLPAMLVTTLHHDILAPALLKHYTPMPAATAASAAPDMHPACLDAGLQDPLGVFHTFAAIPFVFLVDEKRLNGRQPPRSWSDLLDPVWAGEIVFGGWRPNDTEPYQDYNSYLLFCLFLEYGATGLEAFAANVRHLQHNIRTAAQAGSNSRNVGAIAILPWLQAALCPRRERTSVIWPEDGALAMPIGYLVRPETASRVQPLVDYVTGAGLGKMLAHNCYPPVNPAVDGAFPAGARLKWPGWHAMRSHNMALESKQAADIFFPAWYRAREKSTGQVTDLQARPLPLARPSLLRSAAPPSPRSTTVAERIAGCVAACRNEAIVCR